ncbi:MAG: hypothetical protein K2X82_18510 [Gemmataceae bacterium]|nr:hypothetical protein [Gemmataceae bacterium]
MQADFFDATINAYRRRVPYRPFTVVLVNGHQFEVDFPDAIIVRGGAGVYMGPGRVPVIFDHEGVAEIVGDLKDQPADPAG